MRTLAMALLAMITVLLFAVAFSLFIEPAAAATAACAPREVLLEELADRYGETRQTIGLTGGGDMVEMFASDDSGTWTLLLTQPDGMTCAVAAGIAFELIAAPEGDGA